MWDVKKMWLWGHTALQVFDIYIYLSIDIFFSHFNYCKGWDAEFRCTFRPDSHCSWALN